MTDLSYLSDGWLELESDPGLFTLLIEDFGCKNAQVEEIYDLSKVGLIDGHVYGFIFLFKWTEERRSRNRSQFFLTASNQLTCNGDQQEPYFVENENLVNSIFFAHQIVPNSCATHALLSVLLNSNHIDLGDNLNRFKEMTNSMDPESKGLAICNMPELARAHNLHASEIDTQEKRNKQSQTNSKANGFPRQTSGDSFHFISFVCIKNRVYELDGLKKYPIDHGPIGENETFSEKFRKIILERIPQQQQKENKLNLQLRKLQTDMNTSVNEDIRYSLMAVVPNKRKEYLKRLKLLKSKKLMLLNAVNNLIKPNPIPEPYETHSYSKYTATLNEAKSIEVNVNKLILKDVNYNQQLNSNLTTNSMNSSISSQLKNQSMNNSINLTKDNDQNSNYLDDNYSTDTCSDCESRFSDDEESCDDDGQIESLYAFKFVPLKEQQNTNDDTQQIKKIKKLVDENDQNDNNQIDDDDNLKIFTKEELIDFYSDYGFQDLLNILNKLDNEINICECNINEENEKRKKFYVDDSRRTHNYSDFIATYLLMITEQKKLHEFIESKDNKPPVNNIVSLNETEQMDEDVPIKFFKEILTNYEDVMMMDDTTKIVSTDDLNTTNDVKNNLKNYTTNTLISTSNCTANTSIDKSPANDTINQTQSKRGRRLSNKLNNSNNKKKEKTK